MRGTRAYGGWRVAVKSRLQKSLRRANLQAFYCVCWLYAAPLGKFVESLARPAAIPPRPLKSVPRPNKDVSDPEAAGRNQRRTRKDMALKNEERVTATRARLIDAAIHALAEIGYNRTTFVEVSRRSELSRGAIHHHFESIPDLMAAVTRDISKRIQKKCRGGSRKRAVWR